ncbi:RDD family protein [Streptomyces tsukubensis]|uniref:RDD domain-containing protein n=2 Tax=Streptomyces tsukubensis TaxID=83656 RepID=A0A1V4AAV5_9ACTN|nr:RDD family protein [Streptomyces tsukubensis]OON80942.1 hypothetical protein B1H18_11320 [Streptomyces tsukubensis]
MDGAPYPPAHSPYTLRHHPYAGWLRRAGALLMDVLINFGPLWLLTGIGSEVDDRSPGDSGEIPSAILSWVGCTAMIAALVVQLIREGRTGQTVGKSVLGIRAVRDSDGLMPGVGLALLRRLCQYLNFVVFGLGWWWALWDKKKQTFADKIANVVVVIAVHAGPACRPADGDQ